MNSRRNFLKVAGAGITGSLFHSISSRGAKLNTKGQKIKIGVLLPQSNENPYYPGSFLNGLRSGIDRHNAIKKNKIELISESVNFGTPVIVKEKTQKLITENNVDLVTGILNSEVAAHVGNIFTNAKLPVIIANSGESFPVHEIKNNKFLFFNGLNLFQASYHTGRYAVNNYGKNIAIVTSFYDSGYDSLFTFRQGVESAGGTNVDTIVASQDDQEFSTKVVEKLKKLNPDAVYVFMNGNASDGVIRTLHYSDFNIPVLTSAFSVEEHRLVNLGEAAKNIVSIGSWNKNLDIKENQQFVTQYLKKWNKSPDLFSMLGFETGQLIYDSLQKCEGDYSGEKLADTLNNCRIKSPRGEVFIHKKSGVVNNHLLVSKVIMSARGIPKNTTLKSFEPVNEFEEKFAVLDNEYRSGWLNPYLFV